MKFSQEAKNMLAVMALVLAIVLALNVAILPEGNRDMVSWTVGLLALAIFFWFWSRRDTLAERDAGAAEAAEEAAREAEILAKRTVVRHDSDATVDEPDASAQPDDLTKINGIGAVFQTVLNNAGVTTFADVANATVEELEAIIEASGRSRPGRIETWIAQAELAAKGDWDGLQRFKDAM